MKVKVATWSELEDRKPAYALFGNVDLVVVRFDDCGHSHLRNFELRDLTTWKRDLAELRGVRYAGVGAS